MTIQGWRRSPPPSVRAGLAPALALALALVGWLLFGFTGCGPTGSGGGGNNTNNAGLDARPDGPDGGDDAGLDAALNQNGNQNANLSNTNNNGAACQTDVVDTGWFGSVPDLAAGESGAVHVSYVAGGEVQVATLAGGSVPVSVPVPVPDSAGAGTRFRKPRIAWSSGGGGGGGGAGELHLAWGSSDQDLEYARLTGAPGAPGAQWLREGITSVQALLSVPQIAVTPSGEAHVIYQWCQTRVCETSPTVHWFRPHAGTGTWIGPDTLSDQSREWRDDALAADSQGRVHALWKGAYQPGQHRQRSPSPVGTWSPLEEIAPYGPGNTVSFGDLAVDPADGLHHAWYEFGLSAVAYSRRDAGGAFTPTQLVSQPGLDNSDDYDMRPGIAVSPAGVVAVVWAQYDPVTSGPGPIVGCLLQAGSWQCGDLAPDSGVTTGGKPAVAFAGGAFHVVWRHTDGNLRHLAVSCPDF